MSMDWEGDRVQVRNEAEGKEKMIRRTRTRTLELPVHKSRNPENPEG